MGLLVVWSASLGLAILRFTNILGLGGAVVCGVSLRARPFPRRESGIGFRFCLSSGTAAEEVGLFGRRSEAERGGPIASGSDVEAPSRSERTGREIFVFAMMADLASEAAGLLCLPATLVDCA